MREEPITGKAAFSFVTRAMTTLALLAFASAGLLPAAVAAERVPGYWVCIDGAWAPEGRPEHPMPLASCPPEPRPEVTSEAACISLDGRWGPVGIFPKPICVLPTVDGGRFCADEGECEGSCVAELTPDARARVLRREAVPSAGVCTSAVPAFGCMAVVKQGLVDGILCRD